MIVHSTSADIDQRPTRPTEETRASHAAQTCSLTILRTVANTAATKRFVWDEHSQEWRKNSYSAGAWFEPREVSFSGIDGLAAVVEQVRRDSRALIVRGALTEYAKAIVVEAREARRLPLIKRRKHDRPNDPATLVEADRHWLMADVDNWPLPPWADLAEDPDLVVEHAVRELFPPAFHDVRAFWQLSASAGFVAGVLKAHVFFMLAEPVSNAVLKASIAEHAPGVDLAPFQAAQPHFIADPIIEGGHDPLPARTGWIEGEADVVHLPAPTYRENGKPIATGSLPPGDTLAALSHLGHGDGRQGFHAPLRTATLRYARDCLRFGSRDDATLKAQLRDAIRTAPVRAGVAPAQVEFYCAEQYLQPMIDGGFRRARDADGDLASVKPEHEAATDDATTVRAQLEDMVGQSLRQARTAAATGDDPAHEAIAVGVALGKTTTVRRVLIDHVREAKAAGLPHRVKYVVPHHRLSTEIVQDMTADGIKGAVYRGLDADDPDEPGATMCRNFARAEEALRVGADFQKVVCGTLGEEGGCAFREGCAWHAQKGAVAAADVVIASNFFLFHRAAAGTLTDDTGLVVADEAWWQQGLWHTDIALDDVRIGLSDPVLTQGKTQRINEPDTDGLMTWTSWLERGLRACKGDLADRTALLAAGITGDVCAEAAKLEWARKRNHTVRLGMSDKEWKEGLRAAAINAEIPRRVALWRAVGELLTSEQEQSGRIELGTNSKEEPAVLLHLRREIHEGIASRPVLLLDATAPMKIVERFFPRVALLGDMQARAPHLKVNQVLGGWGKTSLVISPKATKEENQRRDRVLEELADFTRLHGSGNAAVITYEGIEDRFKDLPGVATGHFGAIAGLNAMEHVEHLFIVGRPLAHFHEQLADARALTGRPIKPEQPHKATRGVRLADGSGQAINVRAYRDPDLEAVRVAVTDAEIVQAIGRGRGVNRTADNPLTVWLLADIVTPLPVDQLVRWEHVRLSSLARMLARGVALLGPRDAHSAFPWLFPSAEAARKAIDREPDFPDIPLCINTLRGMSAKSPRKVLYRPTGRGQQTRQAIVLPSFLPRTRGLA